MAHSLFAYVNNEFTKGLLMPYMHHIYNHSNTITEIRRFSNDIYILCIAHSIVHIRTKKPGLHKHIKPFTIDSMKNMFITGAERLLLAEGRSTGNDYERLLWRNFLDIKREILNFQICSDHHR